MKNANQFFSQFKNGLKGELNTCAIGQIETFDATRMKADVKVLPSEALIKSVPVASIQNGDFFVRVPYVKGDYVLIVFAQRDIDAILYGGKEPESKRMLSIDDAIVIGGINLFNQPMSGADADKLVIGKKNGAARIVMGLDDSVTIKAPGGINFEGKTKNESW